MIINYLYIPLTNVIKRLAYEGKTTKESTTQLYLPSETIRNYISEIIQKLNAKNRVDALILQREKAGFSNSFYTEKNLNEQIKVFSPIHHILLV